MCSMSAPCVVAAMAQRFTSLNTVKTAAEEVDDVTC